MKYERLTRYLDEKMTMLVMPQRKERINQYIYRLAELEDKIEDGRLLELPCKVGDEVYIVAKQGLDIYAVEKTVICDLWFSADDNCLYPIDEYGVPLFDVFTTRAEAEATLKELKGE